MFLRNIHPGILISLCWQLGLLILSSLALPFDGRKIAGLNPWLKPIKFQLSAAVFLLTVAILLEQLATIQQSSSPGRTWPSLADAIGWTMAIAMLVGNTVIAFQALRGVPSHMNFTTAFNTAMLQIMGVCILFNTLALAALLLVYLDPITHWQWPAAVNLGARLGLAVLLWGSLEGGSMVSRQQHLVGTPDSADGLPVLNWSKTHGDLRIAHFFGIHGIQIFLGIGFLLSCTPFGRTMQMIAMSLFALIYMAGCYQLFRIAMQGRSPLR